MCSVLVVVFEIRAQNSLEMSLVENDDVIEALATNRADQAFRVGILPRRTAGTHDLLDTHMLDPLAEELAVNPIAVTNQKPWRIVIRKGFDNLLRGPFRRRMRGDVEMHDVPSIMAQYDERE